MFVFVSYFGCGAGFINGVYREDDSVVGGNKGEDIAGEWDCLFALEGISGGEVENEECGDAGKVSVNFGYVGSGVGTYPSQVTTMISSEPPVPGCLVW